MVLSEQVTYLEIVSKPLKYEFNLEFVSEANGSVWLFRDYGSYSECPTMPSMIYYQLSTPKIIHTYSTMGQELLAFTRNCTVVLVALEPSQKKKYHLIKVVGLNTHNKFHFE